MDADLRRYYGARLVALWRGELSLRELAAYVEFMPVGSACWALQAQIPYGWTLTDVLLADIFHALTGEPHPLRPQSGNTSEATRHADMFARLKAQKERLSSSPSE